MKYFTAAFIFIATIGFSQEHFGGFRTSSRIGILNATINPSELVNLKSRFEVQLLSLSINTNNNKVGFKDLIAGENIEKKFFETKDPVNANVDAEIQGPAFAMKAAGWGFALTSKSYIKGSVVDVNSNMGDALSNGGLNSLLGSAQINSDKNQRLTATAWGEIGLSAARKIFETNDHQISGGVTFKLLFPASYANVGVDALKGDINNVSGNLTLTNASAGVNFGYSGAFANNFTNAEDFRQSFFGGLNGFATDLGLNYIMKSTLSDYKLKVGASVRNIGTMTFKNDNARTSTYEFRLQGSQALNLNEVGQLEGPRDIENYLQTRGFLTRKEESKDLKVKLPTVFNFYADFQIIPTVSVTAFVQQKLNNNSGNDQINAQNSVSITPRFNTKWFEIFTPLGFQEVAGTIAGVGFRVGGFFLGSNSIITALTSDSKQADAYFGLKFGFL
jgi:hypothetical protein